MRKLFTLLSLATTIGLSAQLGPGLIISEAYINPPGTDSPFEFVELVATRTINFSATPYSIVVANNGNATAQGWIAGGSLGYGFEITTGTVNAGDVVYVGGSSMAATGTILRSINTGTTPGDGFGTANTGGVFGNGGSNADAIGVFASAIAAITPSTVPVDAIFYGTAIGSAVVNAGVDGYQLPVNDIYPGGKLQASSYCAPDPNANYLVATGAFNPTTGAFTTGRTWAAVAGFTDLTTSVAINSSVASAALTITGTHAQVNESAGTATVTINVASPNNGQLVFTLGALPYSTATAGSDYTEQTVVVAAGVSGAQVITIPINNDVLAEKDEYIALAFTMKYNCTSSATAVYHLYIKDNDTPAPVATNELFLDSLSTFSNGASGSNSAEIVAHDPSVQRLYIANSIGAKLDIVNFANPANPTLITTINMTPTYGNINSVAANDSVIALAIESTVSPQDSGKIVFLTYTGVFISQVTVGAMPDMITFNHAGDKVITVCEGEPNAAYTNDPDGCVSIVDISGGVASVNSSNVDFITFTSFNGQEASLRSQGIRIYGPFDMTSKDFEPEYITIADNDSIGWVTLQENNAIAKVDLITNTVIQLMPLGYKNYLTGPAALDASDNNGSINLMNAPVYGMYQPDAISHYTVNNQIYLITANEGDAREYTPVNEPVRLSSLTLDPVAFPYGTQMKQNAYLGRLNVTNETGDTDNDGDFDQIYTFGARSFSIWNGTTGSQVYDSGDNLERVTSTHPVHGPLFNMSNGTGTGTLKNRSDDKGPEPEGTAVANVNGDNFMFLCLERIGGVIMYNINNPAAPTYTGYYNHRTVTGGPDRGAEGIIFIPDSLSPNGNAIIIVANEVSSTLSIFQVSTCAQHAGVVVTPSSASGCVGDTITLTANSVANTTYQWMMNGSPIAGEMGTTLEVTASGDYQLMITNSTNACSGKTPLVDVQIAPVPVVGSSATLTTVCNGTSTTLTGSGATTYNWMPGNLSGTSVAVSPSSTTTYTVTGTSAGCSDTATVMINVLTRPTVTATTTANQVCNGNSTTLNTSGAATYNWQPVNVNGSSVSVTPTATTTYVVTGTAANGCTNTASVTITVLPTPTVTATVSNNTVCSGNATTLQGAGSGAVNYIWFPGLMSGQNVTTVPSATTTYTLTGYGTNGCTHTSTVAVTVNPSPALTTSGQTSICEGTSTTLNVTGASTYVWMPGSSTGTSITVQPASSETYTVTGTGVNGCMDSLMISVTVNANPVASLTTATDTACSIDGSVNLAGSPAGGTYSGNSVAGNSFNPSTAPIGSNQVDYIYVDGNGCSDTATSFIVVDVCTGIESGIASTVNAFPNPFSDQLTITSSSAIEKVEVYNATGQLVISQTATTDRVDLNMSGFESGIYFIRITGAEGTSVITAVRM